MRKYILIVLALLVVVGGGVFLWLQKEQPEKTEDEISSLLNSLKEETEISFSRIQPVDFKWMVEGERVGKVTKTEELAVSGKGLKVEEVSNEQQMKIRTFFEDKGFKPDVYNILAGTITGSTGYKKNQIVCLVSGGVSGGKEGLQRETVTYDAEVKCGKVDGTINPKREIIETKNGDNFSVILETNPTTGYKWELDFDPIYIQLVDRKYTPRSQEPIVGAGGDETFNFLALKPGETEITFSYLRPWEREKPNIEEKLYKIIIR